MIFPINSSLNLWGVKKRPRLVVVYSEPFAEIPESYPSSPPFKSDCPSRISRLILVAQPSNVSRNVTSVIIDSIKRIEPVRLVANCFKNIITECDKIIPPFGVDFYSSAAIICVSFFVLIVAPALNARPQLVEVMMGMTSSAHAVCRSHFGRVFSAKTSAGLHSKEIRPANDVLLSAITPARKEVSARIFVREPEHHEPSETLTNRNLKSSFSWHCDMQNAMICGINKKTGVKHYG